MVASMFGKIRPGAGCIRNLAMASWYSPEGSSRSWRLSGGTAAAENELLNDPSLTEAEIRIAREVIQQAA